MLSPRPHKRVLIYSHDSMGLGHLRRCRTIAHALVDADPRLSVLILSGSPIIGSFDFRTRVDFVRVPGVIKLRNGGYTSLNLPFAIEETLEMRASIMRHTASIFDPDLFIVDKEPLGLRGEVRPTLELMRDRGVPSVLGLRDIMDEPGQLEEEWQRKHVMPALQDLYEQIWVYGLPEICDPLEGLAVPEAVRAKMRYTGYLRRSAPAPDTGGGPTAFDEPYLLVTPGGGGDGETMIDWVISAYEATDDLPWPALLVFGPFMSAERQAGFAARVAAQPRLAAITFDAKLERLVQGAAGVVAMGGYNTFCEILSFDKKALIVPRTEPRLEQFLRAERAQELGLARMLENDQVRSPAAMIEALRRLPDQPVPSARHVDGLLDGLDQVNGLALALIDRPTEIRPIHPALRQSRPSA
jgi:predicted glycosyltransferase